jgi:hypothetical protein
MRKIWFLSNLHKFTTFASEKKLDTALEEKITEKYQQIERKGKEAHVYVYGEYMCF